MFANSRARVPVSSSQLLASTETDKPSTLWSSCMRATWPRQASITRASFRAGMAMAIRRFRGWSCSSGTVKPNARRAEVHSLLGWELDREGARSPRLALCLLEKAMAAARNRERSGGEASPNRFGLTPLGLLLEQEVTLRRQKRFEVRTKTAPLRHDACIEDVDYNAARGLDR